MNEIFINENSLCGQYESIEQFLECNRPFLICMKWLRKHSGDWEILKKSDLYNCKVTANDRFFNLKNYRIVAEKDTNDLLRMLKLELLRIQDNPPFWDEEPIKQEGTYIWNETDMTGTSLAEAAARRESVLSFRHSDYADKELVVRNNECIIAVNSIHTYRYMAEFLYQNELIDADTYVKMYFKETRLNFSKMDSEYGLNQLEKSEIEDCIRNFRRLADAQDWNSIYSDRALVYKAYTPASKKDNWFRDTEYANKKIDKFRCVNPKRCFGYKEDDIFYVLRIERDHKISDNG